MDLITPITLYRGIAVNPEKFEPTWEKAKSKIETVYVQRQEIWFSQNTKMPRSYIESINASNSDARFRIILDVQVPRCFFVDAKNNSSIESDRTYGVIRPTNILDHRVFINRVGIVDYGKSIDTQKTVEIQESDIHWFSYDQIYGPNGEFKGNPLAHSPQ